MNVLEYIFGQFQLSLIQLSSMTAHKGAFGLNIKLEPRFGQRKSGIVERVVLVLSCLFLFCLLSKVAVTLSLFRAGLQSKYVLIMKKVQEKQHHDKEKGNCLLLDKTTPAHRHTGRQKQDRKPNPLLILTPSMIVVRKQLKDKSTKVKVGHPQILCALTMMSRAQPNLLLLSLTSPPQHTKMAVGLH